jgi:hypothetical protein
MSIAGRNAAPSRETAEEDRRTLTWRPRPAQFGRYGTMRAPERGHGHVKAPNLVGCGQETLRLQPQWRGAAFPRPELTQGRTTDDPAHHYKLASRKLSHQSRNRIVSCVDLDCSCAVPKQRVPMRTVITIAALSAAIALAVTTAATPSLNTPVVSQAAQAVLDGVILGSSAWPSVPLDARARLPLFSSACEQEERCKSDGTIDD